MKHVRNFGLYSNVEGKLIYYPLINVQLVKIYSIIDRSLPHVIVVPDTKEGHCEKTYAILKHANNLLKKKGFNWLIVTDDDTILR